MADQKNLAEWLAELESRFKSGNDIPVERIHITRKEFDALKNATKEPPHDR